MDVDIPEERSHKEIVEQYVEAWLAENLEAAVNKVIDERIREENKKILEREISRGPLNFDVPEYDFPEKKPKDYNHGN